MTEDERCCIGRFRPAPPIEIDAGPVGEQVQPPEVEPLLEAYVTRERPRSSWGWYALGYAYFAQQKIRDAIQALARSLELDVKNAEAHKILGRTLMIIGRFDAAQREFEEGIRLSRFCNQKLEEVEKKIELILSDAKGQPRVEPFDEELAEEEGE